MLYKHTPVTAKQSIVSVNAAPFSNDALLRAEHFAALRNFTGRGKNDEQRGFVFNKLSYLMLLCVELVVNTR